MTISGSRLETRSPFAVFVPRIAWAMIGVLCAAAAHEALVALGALSIGPNPGQTPAGEGLVVGAAVLTLACGGLLIALSSLSAMAPSALLRRPLSLVGVASVGFVVARFFSYDAYYAPTLRRMSDGGIVPGLWVVTLVVLAVAAGWTVLRSQRAGFALTALVLWLSAITALLSGAGH